MNMFDSSNSRDGDSVDFLIVGGGAAGSVLANRLSEDSSVRVLLLEAGPDYPATRDVPKDLLDANQFPLSHDWGYQSEPGVLGRSIPVLRAKVIGGSTAHNGADAARGTPEDYDEWSRLGNPGWSFEQLLDDFRRLEDDPEGDVRYHGRAGPVPIRRDTDRLTLLHRSFIRTATASGFRRVADVNGPDQIGVGVVARNVVEGVRQNSSIAYLEPARQRPNLEIRGDAEVDRVVIEEGRVVGVMLASGELLHAGHVVLSAGVYGSPAILMRSGIGPADELISLGIDVVADVPGVGANLAEQPFFNAVFAADPAKLTERTPPLQTMMTVAEPGIAGRPWLHVFPTTFAPGEMSPTGVTFEINVGLLKPRSRGRVTLASRDPKVAPRIDVNLLADPWDVASMVEGIRFARRLASTEPLASLHRGEVIPGDAVRDDADALTEVLKAGVGPYNHANGTVRMGPRSDPHAVVDATCAVRAVAGLSVADASIMPTPPSNPTMLTTMAIAEKVARDLRAQLYAARAAVPTVATGAA
jgi:choline dehydrogenase